uniref:Uncharacterized protein n=1 Tax=Vitis vinifera TaxID=29760 RepID=F6HSG0_VITVI
MFLSFFFCFVWFPRKWSRFEVWVLEI